MAETVEKPKLKEIAKSNDSVYDALLDRTSEVMQDMVERVADTGATCMERDVEFDGQTWSVSVRLKG